jgi:hypothetical protein
MESTVKLVKRKKPPLLFKWWLAFPERIRLFIKKLLKDVEVLKQTKKIVD